MAYQQSFISLDGETFTLHIDGVTPSVALPLSDDPISTDEDSDSDMFMPVRTQSGYIRLLSTDKTTWRQFIPSSATAMPVTLKKGTAIVWQGYVQTGTYGTTWPAIYEDFELPIVCGLSVLESFDVDVQGPGDVVTVGQLLAYLFGKLSGLTYKAYFHCGNPGYVSAWLQYRVIWRNFLDEDDGTLKPSYNCQEILEEVCKFYGWSCRTHGDGIWFTNITDSERNDVVQVFTMAQLANGSSTTFETFSTHALADADFASTDHSEEWIPGCKSVKFNSELNAFDTIIEVPKDELLRKYRNNNVTHGEHWKDHDANECYFQFKGALNYENALMKIKTFVEHESADDSEPQCFGRLAIFDTDMTEPKLRYNWTLSIDGFRSEDYGPRRSSTPLIEIESKAAYILSDGILYINGKSDNAVGGTATCVLKVGNQYWNGTAWTSTSSTFTLKCDSEGVEDTRTSINETEYQGTGIPITTTLTGKIYFAINDVPPFVWALIANLNGYFPLQDFEIGFVRRLQDSEANDLNYTATGGAFPEEVTVDSIFCTDKSKTEGNNTMRCEMGYGLLMSNTAVIDTIPYKSSYQKPEQHNANMIAAYGSTIRQVLTFQLWNSRVVASPKSVITLGGSRYFPVSISHNWRDGLSTIKMMAI